MASGKVHFGGVPTAIDVRKLEEEFPDLDVGTVIKHEAIQTVLGLSRHSCRYKTVTHAWRRKLEKEQNIRTKADPGVGYVVLSPEQRIEFERENFGMVGRAVRRVTVRTQVIPAAKLGQVDLKKLAHLKLATMRAFDATREAATALTASWKPFPVLPQRPK